VAAGAEPSENRRVKNPVDRMTARLPRPWRIAIDWAVTILAAVLVVLAIKAWVVNPYRIPSSSMEPTLHCARPEAGCLAARSDRVLACRFCFHLRKPKRGDIVVFNTPPTAADRCGEGGVFVKRLIGLPGETVGYNGNRLRINGKLVPEPYIKSSRQGGEVGLWVVPKGQYFMMGDNRSQSCDSRSWGSVPRGNLIGPVFMTYWPLTRISFR
jgi:signal peptidase I